MSQRNVTPHPTEDERERETTRARAEIERLAAEQGVKPFDPDEWRAEAEASQSPEEVRREVDEFLVMLREWRQTPSRRGAG
jgi:hypothetical protein